MFKIMTICHVAFYFTQYPGIFNACVSIVNQNILTL